MTLVDEVISSKSADEHAENRADNREELMRQFVETNPEYYSKNFALIGATASFTWTFNWMAAF